MSAIVYATWQWFIYISWTWGAPASVVTIGMLMLGIKRLDALRTRTKQVYVPLTSNPYLYRSTKFSNRQKVVMYDNMKLYPARSVYSSSSFQVIKGGGRKNL